MGEGAGVSEFFYFFTINPTLFIYFFLAGGRGRGGGLDKLSLDNHFSYYHFELWPFEIFIIMNLVPSFPENCSS